MQRMELNQIHLVGVVQKWAGLQLNLDLVPELEHEVIEKKLLVHLAVELEKMASDQKDPSKGCPGALGDELWLMLSSGNQYHRHQY